MRCDAVKSLLAMIVLCYQTKSVGDDSLVLSNVLFFESLFCSRLLCFHCLRLVCFV